MSDDSIRQEFLAELDAILESDEAYGSNIQVLTYSVKDEVINGKFRDSWNKRVYEFIIDIDGISYKPAAKLDSFCTDELPVRFDAYSKGYGSLLEGVRLDRNPIGKRVKKPKCGAEGYGCGFSCIGLAKTCRILSSGQKTKGNFQEKAIGKERLRKLLALGDKILALGKKGALIRASDIKDQISRERNKKAGQLIEARKENTKSIDSYEKFKSATLEIYDDLNKKNKLDDLVPIYQVRRELADKIKRSEFNEWLGKMQADKTLILQGGEMFGVTPDKAKDSYETSLGELRYYMTKLSGTNKSTNAAKNSLKPQEKQPAKSSSDPTRNPKTHSIKTQKEFEDVFYHVVDKLSKNAVGGNVRIAKVREAIGELIPRNKFNQYIKELQGNDDVTLIAGSTESLVNAKEEAENAISTKVNGLRMLVRLEDGGKNKTKNLANEKKKTIEKQLQNRPDLDPLGSARQYTQGTKIMSQKEFEETATKVVQALNDEFNYNDLVPIAKVRETLKERVSPESFDKMMVELQSTDKYQLMGYSGAPGEKTPKELEDGAVITKVNGARHYIKKLK